MPLGVIITDPVVPHLTKVIVGVVPLVLSLASALVR